MKHLLLVLALLAMVVVVGQAQIPPTNIGVWANKSYAASQSDTSKTFQIAGSMLASVGMKYNDSTYVITLVQNSTDGGTTWTFIAGDTLNHTGGGVVSGSTYRELVLRSATVEKFGSVGGLTRIIQKFQATLIGVTTPKYWLWLNIHR